MMTEENHHFLVECLGDINILIKRPLQQTLRIKFTTFDVSQKYLTFGATSGGIYIFDRSKLDFLKLVPSKEGSILKLLICPDEKYVVVATAKGFVIMIENCFSESPIKYQLFREHEGNVITELIWHYNEIYCGDIKGKVSVISLSGLLSKAIFQTPTAILMHLDSPIFQLDACGKLLLVSTRTKTFLCDTEAEQYRQIGKKLRDGDFGACFFADSRNAQIWKTSEREKSRFKLLKADEIFEPNATSSNSSSRIYCVRPGFRLWEANMEGVVLCTYQYKSALHENVTESICLDNDINCRLKLRKMSLNHFENFGRVQIVQNKFLFTYSKNNLVILDKQGTNVLFVYEMRDIQDVRQQDNYLYLWNKKDMRVVALLDMENLLLRVLSARQYFICTELCMKYNQRVLQLANKCYTLRDLLLLKDKCKLAEESKELELIFKTIESHWQGEVVEKNSGMGSHIITVDNGHRDVTVFPSCSYKSRRSFDPVVESLATFKSIPVPQAIIDVMEENQVKYSEPMEDPHYVNNILYKQYQVNQLYDHIETAQLHELLASKKSLDEIVELFEQFIKHVTENALEEDNNVQSWCYSQYLKYINNNRDCIIKVDSKSNALRTIADALKSLSPQSNTLCKCGFPLPLLVENAEYFDVAKVIFNKLPTIDREQLLLRFPSLWKLKVESTEMLALIIQLSDTTLLKEKSDSFTHDNWNDCTGFLVKLKRGKCLNCDNAIDCTGAMSWKDYSLTMLKKIGGLPTTKILQRFAKFIPNNELGYEFYQSCLFSAVSRENGKSCDFIANVLTSPRLENHFEDGLRAYLNQKHLGKCGGDAMSNSRVETKCTVCQLFVTNAILEVGTQLSCGHLFHKLCLESVNGICSICVHIPN